MEIDVAGICCLYVTTMKAMNFQDDIPTFQIDNAKEHSVPMFDLTSMQDTGDDCHYPELVGEPH